MTDTTTEAVERIAAAPWCYASEDISAALRALSAERASWIAAQHYSYIGRDYKKVRASDLEDRAEAAEARVKLMGAYGAPDFLKLRGDMALAAIEKKKESYEKLRGQWHEQNQRANAAEGRAVQELKKREALVATHQAAIDAAVLAEREACALAIENVAKPMTGKVATAVFQYCTKTAAGFIRNRTAIRKGPKQ